MRKLVFVGLMKRVFIIVGVSLLYFSCKKDHESGSISMDSAAIQKAKSWYEKTYVQDKSTSGNYSTSSAGAQNSIINFSQRIKPDWGKSLTYNRLNDDVIEIPIDNSDKFSSSFNIGTVNDVVYKKENSRTSFLLFKKGENYDAFVMTIIADSSYVKNDKNKLANNTYRKHDADFSGIVLYFTPKGKFINCWIYKNGKIAVPEQNIQSADHKVNSINPRPNSLPEEPAGVQCIYYFYCTWDNGILVSYDFLYKVCPESGGGGGSGGGSGTGPVMPPCTIPGKKTEKQTSGTRVSGITPDPVGPAPDPSDGGFPNPNIICCTDNDGDIIVSFKGYPCASALAAKLPTLKNDVAALLKNMFSKNEIVNLTFEVAPNLHGSPTDGKSVSVSGNSYVIGINPDVLANSTKEYILATLYHEGLHAYFDEKKNRLGSVEFSKQFLGLDVNGGRLIAVQNEGHWPMGYDKYIRGLSDAILSFNPNYGESNALALAQGGIILLSAADAKINDQERDTRKGGQIGTKCP